MISFTLLQKEGGRDIWNLPSPLRTVFTYVVAANLLRYKNVCIYISKKFNFQRTGLGPQQDGSNVMWKWLYLVTFLFRPFWFVLAKCPYTVFTLIYTALE